MIMNNEIICIDLEENGYSLDSSERKKFFFNFKYLDFSKAKSQILPYQVPVWIKYIDKEDLKNFEYVVKLVIENIDANSFVKKIASKCELELNYVIYILYNLLLTDCITMVDVFQFSNIYRSNYNMKDFCFTPLKEEYRNFCKLNVIFPKNFQIHKNLFSIYNNIQIPGVEENNIINYYLDLIDDPKFFSYYCELATAKDIKTFIKKVKNFGIFISLFVAFGVYKKILRRINVFVLEKNKEIKDLKEKKEYNNTE